MQIILPNSDFDFPPIAVSIGFYDGLHKGHQFLLNNLKAEAAKRNMASAVITFANHPRQVIEPDFQMEKIGRAHV